MASNNNGSNKSTILQNLISNKNVDRNEKMRLIKKIFDFDGMKKKRNMYNVAAKNFNKISQSLSDAQKTPCIVKSCKADADSMLSSDGSSILELNFEVRMKGGLQTWPGVIKIRKSPEIYLGFVCDTKEIFFKEMTFIEILDKLYIKLYEKYSPTISAIPIDMFPRYCYGKSLFIPVDSTGQEFLIMWNLKSEGFYNQDILRGLNSTHLKLGLTKLARFHAIGKFLAFDEDKINLRNLKRFLTLNPIKTEIEGFTDLWKHFCSLIFEVHEDNIDEQMRALRILRYRNDVEDIITPDLLEKCWSEGTNLQDPHRPWISIVHGDPCGNNVMFKKNRRGEIIDMRLVDLTFTRFGNMIEEMMFFIACNAEEELMNDVESLRSMMKDNYHATYMRVMDTCLQECNIVDIFSYENLQAECLLQARKALYHCLTSLLVIYGNLERSRRDFDVPVNACVNRARRIIDLFVKFGWLYKSRFR